MAKHVIIHLPKVGVNQAWWATADDQGELVSEVAHGTLEDAAMHVEGRRATLVLPGDDVLLAEAMVPGGSASQVLQAVPNVLEEQLADDIDSLHFALGSKGKDNNYPVAVVGRDTMDKVREQCEAASLRPSEIVPETLALPKIDGDEPGMAGWTALVDKQHTVVRLNGYKGFTTDPGMAAIMLDGARDDRPEEASASMVVFQADPHADVPRPDNVDVEARSCDSRLSLYATGLASAPHINLLQGAYSPKTQFDKNWKPWRWTAALLGCLVLALFVSKWLDYRQTQQQLAAIDAQISEMFKKALPQSREVSAAKQIETRIKELSGGNIGGFTANLAEIAASLATQPQTSVRSISYREGRFDLDLTTDAIPTLDLLKNELAKRGSLTMKVLSANREKDGLRSRVRIE